MTWNTLESEKLLTTYMLLLVSMSEYSSQQIEVEISSWPMHLFMKSFSLTRNFAQRVSFEPRDPRQTSMYYTQQLPNNDEEYNDVFLSF